MSVDVLVLNSGEWLLAEELSASPWHILIYRQRSERRNELHVWLPREGARGDGEYAFRRYWMEGETRWCVEIPPDPDRYRGARLTSSSGLRLRFSSPDGTVLWAGFGGGRRLGDFTDPELRSLRQSAFAGPFTRI